MPSVQNCSPVERCIGKVVPPVLGFSVCSLIEHFCVRSGCDLAQILDPCNGTMQTVEKDRLASPPTAPEEVYVDSVKTLEAIVSPIRIETLILERAAEVQILSQRLL